MKTPLTIAFVLIACFKTHAQYYPVFETEVNLFRLINKETSVPVKSFSISELITVAEFKAYLLAIEKDSSKLFYENQLPKLSKKPLELLTTILNDTQLQNEPMPGVSWTTARNYCRWLTAKSLKEGKNYAFTLPTLTELVAYQNEYPSALTPLLESWLQDSYDESMFQFSDPKYYNYTYEAVPNDPPALKRKKIFGGSYHMNYQNSGNFPLVQYEYQDSSSAFIGFRVVRRIGNSELESISKALNGVSVQASYLNNHLNGIYTENYSNGNKKVLGEFYDGQRVGVWSVWDSTGTLKIQRNYNGNREVVFLFPVVENPYAELYDTYLNSNPVRNSDDYYPYKYVEERAVVYSNRVWRELNAENEPELFRQVDFKKMFQTALANDQKLFEYGTSGMFQDLIPKENYPQLQTESENWDFSRIEIKEDFFFSSDVLKGDVRQLGLNFYVNANDPIPKYSFYFPFLRKTLAYYPFTLKENSAVTNLDDYFYFKAYRGTNTRISNVFDREITNSSEKDWEIELNSFVEEHKLWLQYNH